MSGRIASRGRIEYQYMSLGWTALIFVEIKLDYGNNNVRMDAIAQVIAECDGK